MFVNESNAPNLKRTWQERAEREKGGKMCHEDEESEVGGYPLIKSTPRSTFSPYTSIIYLCTHSTLLLNRQCHSIQKEELNFQKKTNLKHDPYYLSIKTMRCERKNEIHSKGFEIQYMHSPFKWNSFILVVTKEGIISDMGKYLF